MKHEESRLQQACVKWFRHQHFTKFIYANANGGKRSRIEAAIMNGEGVVSGVPDLTILIDPGYMFYVEMKSKGGKLTENQMVIINRIRNLGFSVHVCRSIDEFVNVVNSEIINRQKAKTC